MVPAFLQTDLANELKEILKGFKLKNPQGELCGINVYEQLLPMPEPTDAQELPPELLENGLADEQTAPDPYPYIIVRLDEGEIENEDSAQMVSLELLIGIYDPDFNKQGHKDVLNIIAKIYERFAKMPVLNRKYTIQYPILWALQDEETYPFYFGGMKLIFETAAVRREDPYA